ncbi:hypothetical protein C7M84_003124 [Penaeus vannamei]|uniref:Uncharacterized protein n=1 Tax=Penaeus vannamei TaxID=6689 RepID=A0A423TNY0_PENVA|nr:hypothetical protein C7M84_003124 [Penaeus vannamei]
MRYSSSSSFHLQFYLPALQHMNIVNTNLSSSSFLPLLIFILYFTLHLLICAYIYFLPYLLPPHFYYSPIPFLTLIRQHFSLPQFTPILSLLSSLPFLILHPHSRYFFFSLSPHKPHLHPSHSLHPLTLFHSLSSPFFYLLPSSSPLFSSLPPSIPLLHHVQLLLHPTILSFIFFHFSSSSTFSPSTLSHLNLFIPIPLLFRLSLHILFSPNHIHNFPHCAPSSHLFLLTTSPPSPHILSLSSISLSLHPLFSPSSSPSLLFHLPTFLISLLSSLLFLLFLPYVYSNPPIHLLSYPSSFILSYYRPFQLSSLTSSLPPLYHFPESSHLPRSPFPPLAYPCRSHHCPKATLSRGIALSLWSAGPATSLIADVHCRVTSTADRELTANLHLPYSAIRRWSLDSILIMKARRREGGGGAAAVEGCEDLVYWRKMNREGFSGMELWGSSGAIVLDVGLSRTVGTLFPPLRVRIVGGAITG